jgi:hypothetical protein
VAVGLDEFEALVRAVFAGDVAEVAADAVFFVDVGLDVVV